MPLHRGGTAIAKLYRGGAELDAAYRNGVRVWERPNVPTISAFTATPASLTPATWTSQSSITLAWETADAASVSLAVAVEDGTVTAIGGSHPATGNVTSAAPRQDATYALTATNLEGPAVAHSIYRYLVPAHINDLSVTVNVVHGPHPLARIEVSGNFNGHRLTSADVTAAGQSIDFLSTDGSGNYRHLTASGEPDWLWTVRNSTITVGRTPGTARDVAVGLRIVASDGSVATRSVTARIPA